MHRYIQTYKYTLIHVHTYIHTYLTEDIHICTCTCIPHMLTSHVLIYIWVIMGQFTFIITIQVHDTILDEHDVCYTDIHTHNYNLVSFLNMMS